jgi:hypothetical protein
MDIPQALEFLASMAEQHGRVIVHAPVPKILSFTATCSRFGSFPTVGIRRLAALVPSHEERELQVMLKGDLPRRPIKGELLSLCMADFPRFRGYQVKTSAMPHAGFDNQVAELLADGTLLVHGRFVYTIHHSPNQLTIFENIPFADVQKDLAQVPFALLAIGEQANISPRFIFHHAFAGGRLQFFHGDGHPKKTYMNLQANSREVRLVVDLSTQEGWAFYGAVEQIEERKAPSAVQRIREGFTAGDWGTPRRLYCFTAERWEKVPVVA